MTWVPPYAVSAAKARLNESFEGIGIKDSLTDLALQFWQPTPDGCGVQRVQRGDDTSDTAILQLRDWGRAHGIRVLLCVYNYSVEQQAWDWPAALTAFADHPEEFAESLVAELERLDLDGIDLDLEGNGPIQNDNPLDSDKEAYLRFIRDLSARVRVRGKRLTVDTFAHVWHAPNQTWWKDLFPLVDCINSMGYDEIGASAVEGEAWRSYAAQESASGDQVGKLMLGLPSFKDEWLGNSAIEHLRWLRDRGRAGLSLWDSQLEAAAWQTHEAWALINEIQRGSARGQALEPPSQAGLPPKNQSACG